MLIIRKALHYLTKVLWTVAVLAWFVSAAWGQGTLHKPAYPSIRVTGEGAVTTKPDQAQIDIGVVTEAGNAQAAATQNAEKLDAVLSELRKALGPGADIKITSYSFNGAIIAYQTQPPDIKTSKFRLSSLRPTGILLWEANEDMTSFNFNDVGNQPHEGISQRHASSRIAKAQTDIVGGIATFGTLSGSGTTIKISRWFSPELAGRNIWPAAANPAGPNDAWYNPASRDGTY